MGSATHRVARITTWWARQVQDDREYKHRVDSPAGARASSQLIFPPGHPIAALPQTFKRSVVSRVDHGNTSKAARCPHRSTKAAMPVETSSWSKSMWLPFGHRTAELKTKNRILTDAARKRAERIKELEHQVAQLERQVAHLKQELESARKRASEPEVRTSELEVARKRASEPEVRARELEVARKRARELEVRARELEVVATQRAHLLNEKVEEVAGLREVLTQRARSLNKNIEELGGLREALTQRARSLNEKDEGIAGAREVLTKCSLRIRELENALLEIYK
jgi:hypothetical protein